MLKRTGASLLLLACAPLPAAGAERAFKVLTGHSGEVRSICFSSDTRFLVSSGFDKAINLWDMGALRGLKKTELAAAVNATAVLPGNLTLIAGGDGRNASLLSLPDLAVQRALPGLEERIVAIQLSADGERAALALADRTTHIYDARGWERKQSLPGSSPAFSPDGRTLALAGADGTVRIHDARTWKLLRSLEGHADAVQALAFSADGSRLASGGRDATVRVWNCGDWKQVRALRAQPLAVRSLAFSRNGKWLAAGGATVEEGQPLTYNASEVLVWGTGNWEQVHSLPGLAGSATVVAFSPDQAYLAAAGVDKTIHLWRLSDLGLTEKKAKKGRRNRP